MIFKRLRGSASDKPDQQALGNAFERFKQTRDLEASAKAFGVDPRLLAARIGASTRPETRFRRTKRSRDRHRRPLPSAATKLSLGRKLQGFSITALRLLRQPEDHRVGAAGTLVR